MIDGWQGTETPDTRLWEVLERVWAFVPAACGAASFCGLMLGALWIINKVIYG